MAAQFANRLRCLVLVGLFRLQGPATEFCFVAVGVCGEYDKAGRETSFDIRQQAVSTQRYSFFLFFVSIFLFFVVFFWFVCLFFFLCLLFSFFFNSSCSKQIFLLKTKCVFKFKVWFTNSLFTCVHPKGRGWRQALDLLETSD